MVVKNEEITTGLGRQEREDELDGHGPINTAYGQVTTVGAKVLHHSILYTTSIQTHASTDVLGPTDT